MTEKLPNGLTIDEAKAEAARAYELDRAHVFHSWAAQAEIKPMVITASQGSYVYDGEGRKLLDFSSQLVNTNIGHQHPKVTAAIAAQAAKLCTIAPSYANAARSEAARLVASHTPGELNKIFFTNGGADAVEHAARMARLHTGRPKILSRYRSYHGATEQAINITGDPRRWPSDQAREGVVHFFGPFLYRSAFYSETQEQETQRALAHLEQTIEMEGPGTIAAIILESIPGTAGIMVPPPGYMEGVRELCTKHGIVFIADEVMAGFGRTGEWFAIDNWGVTPDLITFAKGVNSGYVPLGGVAISPEIYNTFAHTSYPGGLTYSGHPLATAAAVATINAMEEEDMVGNAKRIGADVLGPGLRALAEKHSSVGEVRGLGVFWAVELVADKATREPLAPYGSSSEALNKTVAAAKDNGVIVFQNYNRIHMVPACNVTADEVQTALVALDKALDVADGYAK
jgi:taurine--2-oxoglutarate transaminase